MPQSLLVGVGRQDITPPLGTALMGYGDPELHRTAESVHDPLHATALAFQSGDRRSMLVSLDVCVIEDVHVAAIRQGIQARTGIDGGLINVSTIQTHSAPRTQQVWGWCDLDMDYIQKQMIPGAIEAAALAAGAMVPARMGIGTTQSRVGVNRRGLNAEHTATLNFNRWALYDPEMTVLRFESATGTLANVVHYGAHPTVYGYWSRVISRDWPGIMIDRLEQLTKAPTLFLNGAVGDIAPRTSYQNCIGDNETALWEAGARAALDAMETWKQIKDFRDVAMHTRTATFQVPYRPLMPLEEAKRGLVEAEPHKSVAGGGMATYKHLQAVIDAHSRPIQNSRRYHQVITALGPLAMVPFPGEPFAETILRLRHDSPFQHTLGISTACGNMTYFPTKEAHSRGGYEAWVGKAVGAYLLREDVADVLIDLNMDVLKGLHAEVYPPIGA